MDVLLTIGEFSKMTYLSVKALRHYHDVGLLAPVEIDPSSGYRRYAASQVATAQAIRRFRDLDMPLDDVRRVLAAADEADRDAVIVEHLARLQDELARTQQSVASLQSLLTERPKLRADVELRHVGAQSALVTRRRVDHDEVGGWLDDALTGLRAGAHAAGLAVAGPDGALWPDEFFEDEVGEVTAFVPLEGPTLRGGPPGIAQLPAITVAVLVHEGPFADADQTYGALGTIVAERGIGADGPIREHYLGETTTEVCWPVTIGAPR